MAATAETGAPTDTGATPKRRKIDEENERLHHSISSVPVVGQNIVAGPKKHHATKTLVRPPHSIPAATWHLNPDLDRQGPLSREQLGEFYKNGFIFIPDFYKETELDAVREDVERMIDDLAVRLYRAGKLKSTYEDLDWTSRLLRMRKDFPDAPVILIKGGILPAALQTLFAHKKILDIAEQLDLGPSIALNPAWNLRAKMPSHEETVVPWHQDNSYWEPRIWDEKVITIWVALVDATVENGCMQMVKGGHRKGETASHTIGSSTTTWYTEMSEDVICSQLLDNAPLEEGVNKVTIPAKAGSILIFPGTTPHRSLNSFSDNIRWSCDFRLHPKVAARPGKSDLDWFYGLKDSLLLREDMRINPTFTPDFSQWADTDRTECQDAAKGVDAHQAKEEFDPVIMGPWMDLWDLEDNGRPNKHIDAYLQSDPSPRDVAQTYIRNGNW
eukprot:m.939059 g.939059  ORF g.939059 m.939059 type:complete len:443 (+) comp23823_c1_seq9:90-1418(+)